MFYADEYEPACVQDCPDCLEKDETLSECEKYLKSIVNELYSRDPLDLDLLENHLEDLCHLFRMNIPKEPIQIVRKLQGDKTLTSWIKFNNDHLKSCLKK